MPKILNELNIHVDTENLNLPPVHLTAKHDIADYSALPKIIGAYFNKKDITYDIDGLKLLRDHFECYEEFAHTCLEFDCSFTVSDSFIENYINELDPDEDNYVWGIQEASLEEGEQIRYGATEIFSSILKNNILQILGLMNITRPGCIRTKCLFIDRAFNAKEFNSSMHDIQAFRVSDIYEGLYMRNNETSHMLLQDINIWYKNLKKYSQDNVTNLKKSLNRYFSLFVKKNSIEILLTAVAALESLYVQPFTSEPKTRREPSKQNQLIKNIPLFLDIESMFPNKSFEEIIRTIYDDRSRVVHGDLDIGGPFDHNCHDVEDSATQSLLLLVFTLKKACKLNLMELNVPYIKSLELA